MTRQSSWRSWLKNHPSNDAYNRHPKRVAEIGMVSMGEKACFEKLTQCKNLGLLTKSVWHNRGQISFYHSTVRLPILEDELHYVARGDFELGTGVKIDSSTIFEQSSRAKHVPSLLEMMKATTADFFNSLTPDTTGTKKKIKNFAILPPFLMNALADIPKLDFDVIFTKIVNTTRNNMGNRESSVTFEIEAEAEENDGEDSSSSNDPDTVDEEAQGTEIETEDSILMELGEQVEDILISIWAMKNNFEVDTVPFGILNDPETRAWEMSTRSEISDESSIAANTDPLSSPTPTTPGSDAAAIAMNKLADSMTTQQETQQRLQEEKNDTRLKAWRKLPTVQKSIILGAGINRQHQIPEEPTEELLIMMGVSNGAQVGQYLQHLMPEHNIHLEPGLCSCLHKGIFLCPEYEKIPKHFTPFLTPPTSISDSEEADQLRLSMVEDGKYSKDDLERMTKQKASIPMNVHDLQHQVKNYAGLVAKAFGDESIAYEEWMNLSKNTYKRERSYAYQFKCNKWFGGCLLDKLNWRMMKFLESCASGEPEDIDITFIDFGAIITNIERREFQCQIPSWIRTKAEEDKKKDDDETNPINGGGVRYKGEGRYRGGRLGSQNDRDGGRSRVYQNGHNVYLSCKLLAGEKFKDIFHPANIGTMPKPRLDNGKEICLRSNCPGYSFIDCQFCGGMDQKPNRNEVNRLSQFVSHCRLAANGDAESTSNKRKQNGNDDEKKDNPSSSKLKTDDKSGKKE
mmetsp:Transcript_4429/g.5653  ORF Transcript_4429/g.5653 Transcript_4429/m.5653 type:complete len:741 (+) Transcript_4429:65-2287(+)|eukprot:CAMPEP_0172499878 /NCGR_PEP_ID=MMETSP1066-20121228/132156_1 /TAXON_ID=671091 /ORGANISM="Coscinodiscus wailesii, Strain CCMP2513" /LENGTH=740 /DNA_ID=CAMNT_0013273861 /DNA_START=62 /DNA_END=2284 /DNA_ORIENTATION=-